VAVTMHEDFDRREDARPLSDRAFGFVLAVALAIAGLSPLRRGLAPRFGALMLSATSFALVALAPKALHPLNRVWTRVTLFLNRLMSSLATALLFYGVFTPMATLRRLRGNDSLALGFDPSAPSYWKGRQPPGPAPKTMIRQF
jgi:hypothetical protein